MCRHLLHALAGFAALGGCAIANPLGSSNFRTNASMPSSESERLMLRDTLYFDASDLSFITTMAAIGDSYSAGIGAGNKLGNIAQALITDSDWACSRYDHSYPYLINNDERLGDPSTRTFQFLSCSGALITDVLTKQIPNINSNQQVILLSAGGNDVGLSALLNQCVYQWAVLNAEQVVAAKAAALLDSNYEWAKDIDWDSLGLGCDGQLDLTQTLIAGAAFSQSLDSVIAAAQAKLSSNGMIYYTGYAKFWAEDLSSACDSVSWSTWIYKLYNIFQPDATLTTAHRTRMNSLVDAINAQISAAVERAGSNVKFVNYDSYVGYFGGRFCEAGVDESTTASNTRTGLMFYELSTWDTLTGLSPWKRSTDSPLEGTFAASVQEMALITLLMDPDAQLTEQSLVTSATASVSVGASANVDILGIEIPNVLPDGFGRVFHPQILLHEIIASLAIYEMINVNEENNGYPGISENLSFDSCPWYLPSSVNSTNGTTGGQQIALASYINPLSDPAAWTRMINYPDNKVSVLIANVLNGPDTTVNTDWQTVINEAFYAGKRVIGYVRTGYLGVSVQQFQTRLGSSDLADWVSQIQTDVDLWYQLYPGMIGGIFFDEGWNECGTGNQYSELYRLITETTKRKYPGAFTVLNPGATMPQCFEHSADTLMTFESSFETYTAGYVPNPDWTPSDPRKIWHIIYNVPEANAAEVVALAKERGAGLIHITDDTLPNPYDTLPAESYMQTLINAIDGGSPLVAAPLPYPTDGTSAFQPASISVTGSDYSSVSLSWPNSGVPYALAVMLSGKEVVRLPGTMSRVTIGNIAPGSSSLSFTLRAIGGDGIETGDSSSATASTPSLPNNQPVANVQAMPSDSSTTISADVLIPYSFLHVFITDPDTHCNMPAWPINYDAGDFVCSQYMVEGSSLYKYSGANLTGTETNYAWAWTYIGYVPITRSNYTYTWTLPIGTSTVDPNYYIVQAQGYGPLTNIFHPCPSTWDSSTSSKGAYCSGKAPYDCKGEPLCSTTNVKWCDEAVNNMERGSKIYTANGASLAISGNCWANYEQYGCSVQIRGTDENGVNCQITGDDMWQAYQDIRNIGGCSKCGSKHFGNGCLVSVDYYYGCDNRDPGPNRL